MSASAILLIIACILFFLAAFGVNSPVGLGWLGAALVTIAFIITSGAIR